MVGGPGLVLGRAVRARAAERPDATAVVDPANRADLLGTPPRRLSWHELDDEVDALAATLAGHGIGVDDVVGTQLPNTVELVLAYLALVRLGAIVCPFPMAHREYELSTLGPVAGLAAVLTVSGFAGRDHVATARTAGVPVLAWGAGGRRDAVDLDARREPPPAAGGVARLRRHPSEVVTLCWTSGTEAAPKAVPRCANGWDVVGRGCAAAPALTADDVILSPFPLVNMAGFGGVFVPWLLTGATLVAHHPFDMPTFLSQIATERVSYTLAPPALLVGMLDAPGLLERADLSSLRVIGSGSAPLPPRLIRDWRDRCGIEVTNFFGSNEGIGLISDQHTVPDPEERARYFPWFGGPGLSWPNPAAAGIATRLVADDGTEVTAPGTPGELRVAGPTVFSGYWPGPGPAGGAPSPEGPFDERGYFRTGDVFEIAGHDPTLLRYLDRSRDIVVRGGMNISPGELEELIGALPGIAEVAVVGTPDERLGERVAAVVVPAPGADPPTLEAVVAALRERRIASYKLPERLEVLDALPRNPLNKVLKRELRARLA